MSASLSMSPERTAPTVRAEPTGLLQANDEAYRLLLARLLRIDPKLDPEAAARGIERTAFLASHYHAGRFADGTLEDVARKLGALLDDAPDQQVDEVAPRAGDRRVLHVMTSAWDIGGLTRTIDHWVRHDASSSVHSVAIVDQGERPVPGWLQDAIEASGGSIFRCEADWPLLRRAGWLRSLARRSSDLVVLHAYPFDVVPVLAFGVEGGPPVAVLNHADHVFWIGSSIADTVINHRTAGARHTAERRFIDDNLVLPVPLTPHRAGLSRAEARRELGIPGDRVVLLSVARAEKYQPSGSYDFMATAGRILDRNPRAEMFVVGATVEGIAPFLRGPIHERLHLVGSIPDPTAYRAAADVYVESFPFGSQTALLEAALAGLPVVPAYAPIFPLIVTNDDSLLGLLENPADEDGYIERTVRLMNDPDERRAFGERLRSSLLADHVGEGLARRIADIYRHTDTLRHVPRRVPVTACETTPGDVSLSTWHILAERDFRNAPDALGLEHAVAIHAGQVARMIDEYGEARRHALRAIGMAPTNGSAWRLLALSILGPRTKRLKALLQRSSTESTR